MLFDAHLHLAEEYTNTDFVKIKALVEEAKENGVERFITNSINFKTNLESIELAKTFDDVYFGIGIYPTELKSISDLGKIDKVFDLYNNLENDLKKKLLVGEIGLDFKESDVSEQELQIKGFIKQIEFAKERKLFLEIHSRFAIKQTLDILIANKAENVIMHWYTNSKKYTMQAADNGYHITIGPSYLYSHDRIYDVIKDLDPKQVLFETDYPVEFDGKVQAPKVIKQIAEQYCKDFEIEMKELKRIQAKTFKRLFSL